MTKAKKVTLLLSIIVIVIGAILFAVMGFNYDLSYGTAKRIMIETKGDFEIEDYTLIAKEIYGDAKVETISQFKEGVSIKVKDTNDEQLNNLVSKVNEKYGYEYTRDDLIVTELPKVEVFSIIKQAIIPLLITTLIILAYMIIRYKKQGLVNIILSLFIPVILVELLVLAIHVICRIPVTNMLLPTMLTAYIVSVIYSTKQLEK